EKDRYLTLFGAVSAEYKINKEFKLTTIASRYNTQEEEYFDILAQYRLGEVDTNIGSTNFGEVSFSEGIGSQLNHARNDLDALITNLEIKASVKNQKSQLDFGIKFQQESIKDRIREWEVIDSLGFSIRPLFNIANNQPYEPFEGAIIPFQNIRKDNNVYINRITSFLQFSKRVFWNNHEVFYNIGVRGHAWFSKGNGVRGKNQIIVSPRGQFAIKPDWNKDILFRFSGGLYAQPPSYRELRDFNGALNINVDAQKSIHSVVGMDYSFELWNRPFKLTSEAYFKNLSDVNSYTIDNVRIRYRADNVTKAYVYGLDLRLNGEFVPGSESWVSLGLLKTEENINDNGYIARPSDQRIKFGILFQDYVPNLPNLKAYLNLVYNSGVPGGSPSYADPYNFQQRLRDYRRADLGVSYIFVDDNNKQINTGLLSNFKEFSVGLELFNIFDIQNAITNTWVRDVYSKTQFGIPNYMTGRVLNFKVAMKF
ncbi:MAG: TonB-dependent receptor, partial [Polaribacter sp.]